MMKRIAEKYASVPADERLLFEPAAGKPCIAFFADDDQWYRGLVKSVEGESYVVHFVDYGNSSEVPKELVKYIEPEFLETPVLAACCTLASVQPKSADSKWDDDTAIEFEGMLGVGEKEMLLECFGEQGGKYEVKLLDMGIDVAESLVAKELACKVVKVETESAVPESELADSQEGCVSLSKSENVDDSSTIQGSETLDSTIISANENEIKEHGEDPKVDPIASKIDALEPRVRSASPRIHDERIVPGVIAMGMLEVEAANLSDANEEAEPVPRSSSPIPCNESQNVDLKTSGIDEDIPDAECSEVTSPESRSHKVEMKETLSEIEASSTGNEVSEQIPEEVKSEKSVEHSVVGEKPASDESPVLEGRVTELISKFETVGADSKNLVQALSPDKNVGSETKNEIPDAAECLKVTSSESQSQNIEIKEIVSEMETVSIANDVSEQVSCKEAEIVKKVECSEPETKNEIPYTVECLKVESSASQSQNVEKQTTSEIESVSASSEQVPECLSQLPCEKAPSECTPSLENAPKSDSQGMDTISKIETVSADTKSESQTLPTPPEEPSKKVETAQISDVSSSILQSQDSEITETLSNVDLGSKSSEAANLSHSVLEESSYSTDSPQDIKDDVVESLSSTLLSQSKDCTIVEDMVDDADVALISSELDFDSDVDMLSEGSVEKDEPEVKNSLDKEIGVESCSNVNNSLSGHEEATGSKDESLSKQSCAM